MRPLSLLAQGQGHSRELGCMHCLCFCVKITGTPYGWGEFRVLILVWGRIVIILHCLAVVIAGQLARVYCSTCRALFPLGTEELVECPRPTCEGRLQERNALTNSLPLEQSLAVFTKLLPCGGFSLQGKELLDIGSRLGNQLVIAALLGSDRPRTAVGFEISQFFVKISREMAAKVSNALAELHVQLQTAAATGTSHSDSGDNDGDTVVAAQKDVGENLVTSGARTGFGVEVDLPPTEILIIEDSIDSEAGMYFYCSCDDSVAAFQMIESSTCGGTKIGWMVGDYYR